MAIKSAGTPLAFTDVTSEFGGAKPWSLSQFYRGGTRVPNGATVNNGIATSGAIRFGAFFGAVKEFQLAVSANVDRYNMLAAFTAAFGAPSGAVVVRLTNNATIGSTTAATAALTVGQFPSGSIINIDNNISIIGAGGAANGGTGGSAINANYPNQTVTINNPIGAKIYGGGGGGGGGGSGGAGGLGGAGTYNYWGAEQYVADTYDWTVTGDEAAIISYGSYANIFWGGSGSVGTPVGSAAPGGQYIKGTFRENIGRSVPSGESSVTYYDDHFSIQALQTAYTGGGSGGAGGAGGSNGGRGQGYDGANAGSIAGATGAAGAAGGTNAGTGGAGGDSGVGGAGGTYGLSGAAGGTGNAGATGASGNNGAGAAGSGGAAGYAGGAPGQYLIKGTASVTVNNNGSLLGTLA